MDAGRLRDAVARLLRANWREGRTPSGTEYGYTCPDPVKYPDQFFWDSCLHAVAWSHVDPSRARRELRTLVAAQRPDGLIGHTVFWRGRVRPSRAFTYNLIRISDRTTATIQPPLLAWAWAEVADRSPDEPGFRAEGLPALRRYHAWLDRERADGDGLLGILQPDESGLDATPAYDAPLGLPGPPATRASSCCCGSTAAAASRTGGSSPTAASTRPIRSSTPPGPSPGRAWRASASRVPGSGPGM